jgi:hypothetical protein
MPRDIDPEEMLPVAADFTQGFRDIGVPIPDGFPETVVALFMILAEVRASDCHCDACDRFRVTAATLENL